MRYCIDCGKPIQFESSVPVKYDGKRAYICISCYRRDVRYNPLSGYVSPLMYQNPKLYESFHGSKSKGIRKVKYNAPKPGETLVKIGRLVRLEYEPEFPSKHTGVRFFHVMGDTGETKLPSNTILATDTKGENLYILKDKPKKRPYFSGRGIIG